MATTVSFYESSLAGATGLTLEVWDFNGTQLNPGGDALTETTPAGTFTASVSEDISGSQYRIKAYDGATLVYNGNWENAAEVVASSPVSIENQGTFSSLNSTTTALGSSETYTGTFERIDSYASITIAGSADAPLTAYWENSNDGINPSVAVKLSDGDDGIVGVHGLITTALYGRLKLVGGTAAGSTMNVYTTYNKASKISVPTGRAAGVLNDYSDCLPIRLVSDIRLDEVNGKQADRAVVSKFGSNGSIGTSSEDIWSLGGAYTGWLQAASAVRVKAGGNAADDAAGAGARTVVVVGLDENWEDASEAVTLAGASASSATTTTFLRVNRVYVSGVGTYGASNTGAITVETTGGVTVAYIDAGYGQTKMSMYTVPANKRAFIKRISIVTEGTKTVDLDLWRRDDADMITAPYGSKRIIREINGAEGVINFEYDSFIGPLEAKTDIWATGITSSGTVGVSLEFDMVLVNV